MKPMVRSNICLNSHPQGCKQEVLNQIAYTKSVKEKTDKLAGKHRNIKNVLVLGCSTGYGLASRITAAFAYGADTIGVSFEKEGTEKKFGTPGWYNNMAFDAEAKKAGLFSTTLNGDAYSDEVKAEVIKLAKEHNMKFDLVVYSLASPVRTDPDTKVLYRSVIKPIGKDFSGVTFDTMTGEMKEITAEAANEEEIANTVKVMGGEDWERWIKQLSEAGVLAEGCRTVAYSYIGPSLSHPIYRDGTIGAAKKDLEARAKKIDADLKANGGAAYVSVNKALITRSSSVIPIICQYIGVLFKIMKAKGTHEGCIEQMERLFAERLYTADKKVAVDEDGRIRMDDWEMDPAVQAEVDKIMPQVTEENVNELVDMAAIRHDFLAINGFDIAGIDYEKDVADMTAID